MLKKKGGGGGGRGRGSNILKKKKKKKGSNIGPCPQVPVCKITRFKQIKHDTNSNIKSYSVSAILLKPCY